MLNILSLNEPAKSSEDEKLARKWNKRLQREQDDHEDSRKQAEKAYDVFLDQQGDKDVYYPLLWSVVQVQHSAVYSSAPIPVATPRNGSQNDASKRAAEILERAIDYCLDQTDFDETLNRTADDYLAAGLGVPRVKLDAEITEIEEPDPMTGEMVSRPVITEQMVRAEYVPWSRFGWEPATCWEHVNWIYFKHRMTSGEIKARYGDDASFKVGDKDNRKGDKKNNHSARLVDVYEIWDKKTRTVIHMANGGKEPLSVDEDPLGLSDFFPIPKPLMTNVNYDSLEPIPDYQFIRFYDEELNRLYSRAKHLTEEIKAWSVHDASFFEIESSSEVEDGQSVPIENLAQRLGQMGAGLDNVIKFFPIRDKVEALQVVTQQIDIKKRTVDELLGISDVLRGGSNPQDGQRTNEIKERWSGIRLRRKQNAIQELIRHLFRLMSEVAVKHITRENLQAMTQVQIDEEVWAILQDDVLREFSIDMETDSTIAKDEFKDKRERSELLQSVSQYVQTIAPAIQANGLPADLGKELLTIAVAPYMNEQARSLSGVIEQMMTTQQQLSQIQQLTGQVQQLTQQMQQKDYALAQYSQAEEQRKNMEVQAKTEKDRADAMAKMAGIDDEQLQAGLTRAETFKKAMEGQKIQSEMMKPDCGCSDCTQGMPCGCSG